MMAKTGLLVVSNPARVVGLLPQLQKHVLNKLYIQYLPDRFTRLLPQGGQGQVTAAQQVHPPTYGPVVIGLYRQSLAHNIDVTVLLGGFKDPFLSVINNKKPIEVVFFDQVFNGEEVNTFLKSYLPNVHSDCKVVSISDGGEGAVVFESDNPTEHQVDKMYDNVVLGGTFDRLHAGHKVLLSEAVLRCQKRLTVGVTDENMLKSKILWEIVQPCELRIALVREFLEEICPSLEYNIVPISDAFGPTKDDPQLEMIVVSAETLKGGFKVNEVRAAKSLCTLDIHAVDLLFLKEKQEENEEDKVSSSNIRMRLLGKRLQIPPENTTIARKPYVIGLTGGIASGKSSVSDKLRKMGASVINCDLLAHDLYKKGEPLLQKLVDHFGEEILDSNGEVNRKALGSIVFNNEEQRQKLNNLVWPALLERVKDEISKLFSAGRDVVFVEAAVLLQAGWASHCHEVWVCLVPPEEAIKRLQKRNDLSEADAAARVKAQPSNVEHVRLATVVLCTLWSYDYTQKQVAQAWNDLQKHLRLRAGKL